MIESNFQVDELIHERGLQYGHPRRFFMQLAKVWGGALDIEITPQKAATMMLMFKAVEAVQSAGQRGHPSRHPGLSKDCRYIE